MATPAYPKRLIEVDLPIKKISEHARREKSIRHGHISTLHIWWARRPLAACRAVICAALWPDPADPLCPERFRFEAEDLMRQFWNPMGVANRDFSDPATLRQVLLDFIADFSNWDNSTNERYLSTARKLTQISHESLGGEPGTRPLVVDPFAGGGSIPLEALRVGADAYASDLNPVAVLLNKVVLEYIPKYGKELAYEVKKWGQWIKEEAEKELAEFYPKDPDGATPIAYLWARTIRCEGPGCGAEVPLIRSLWLAKKRNRSVGLRLIPDRERKQVDFKIIENAKPRDVKEGTVRRGSATCPICGYTTSVDRVREQLKLKIGGVNDSYLYCVVLSDLSGKTIYRPPSLLQLETLKKITNILKERSQKTEGNISLIPDESLPIMSGVFNAPIYGHSTWGSLFPPRQALMLSTYVKLIEGAPINGHKSEFQIAIRVLLALTASKMASFSSSLCIWRNVRTCVAQTFGRQALPMVWDYGEMNPFIGSAGDFSEGLEYLQDFINHIISSKLNVGHSENLDATTLPLPSDCAALLATDPPYYNAVPYADLSDFFYIWLRRMLGKSLPETFSDTITPKSQEICEMAGWDPIRYPNKTGRWFEERMGAAMFESRRITAPNSLGVTVFAHKTAQGWEAQIKAMIEAGWRITGSWPIDTERTGRLRAYDSAVLTSSIHLVCRPRENPDGSLREEIGDWRDILSELPCRIHEWMPRLAKEGVVGADAIFACLGPALEIFSRYSRVEKASGEEVSLREYLEHVWAAVSREALGMIFDGADATGFEEDARITAMWLWTLKTAESPALNGKNGFKGQKDEDDEEEGGPGKKKIKGFSLEYDAARKIAQGLGAHLEEMHTLVEIKKGNARLLPVSERAAYLLKSDKEKPVRRPKKKEKQATLFLLEIEGGEETEEDFGDIAEIGKTALDRVHQSMLLFAAGESNALKRFLVDEGIGKNAQFWNLAQALAALYPTGTEEKRWVEGVLARKKGLGL